MALTAEEIKRRRNCIGASDVPVILGLSKWKTAHELYAEKTSTVEPVVSEDEEVSKWGHRLEPLIVKAWGEARGIETAPWVSGPLVHSDIPWATCSPDGGVVFRLAVSEGDPGGFGIEAKNRAYSTGWGPSDSDQIPADVEAQVRWSMFVSGCDRWGVGVLLGGNQFRHYLIWRNMEWESYIFPTIEAFREGHFIAKPEWAPVTTGEKRTASEAESNLISNWLVARGVKDAAEAQFKEYDRDLRATIGGSLGLISPAGVATLGVVKGRETIDWEAIAKKLAPWNTDKYEAALAEHTSAGTPYRRLTVKAAKPSEGKEAVK